MTPANTHIARVLADTNEVFPMEPVFQERSEQPRFAMPPSNNVETLQRQLNIAFDMVVYERQARKAQDELLVEFVDALRLLWEASQGLSDEEIAARINARNLLAKVPQ